MSTPLRLAVWRIVSPPIAVTLLPLSMNGTQSPSSLTLDLISKMLHHAANRIRRRLSEATDRSVGHRLRQFFQQCGIPLRLPQQVDSFFCADAARRALPARLVGEKLHHV